MNRIVEIFRRRSRGGVNRLIVILLALIAVMLVIIAIPKWEEFRYRSEKTACVQALKSARDGLIIDYFDNRPVPWRMPGRRWTRCCPCVRASAPPAAQST